MYTEREWEEERTSKRETVAYGPRRVPSSYDDLQSTAERLPTNEYCDLVASHCTGDNLVSSFLQQIDSFDSFFVQSCQHDH